MQTERRASRLLHRSRSEEMIEVRMGVQNVHHGQPQPPHFMQNAFRGPARVDHDRLLGDRIPDDRTIASQRRDGKRFSDHAVPFEKCTDDDSLGI